MAWPDAKLGHRLVGYFVPRTKEKTTPEALIAFLRDWLPDYMVPAVWIELSDLPLNPNGKLDRKSLPQPTKFDPGQEFQAPTTPTEQILAGLWGGILSRD